MKASEVQEGMLVTYRSEKSRGRKGVVVAPEWTEHGRKGVAVLLDPLWGAHLVPEVIPPGQLIPWEQFQREEQEREEAEVARRKTKLKQLADNKARSEAILARLKAQGIESGALRLDVWDQLESRDLSTLLEDLLTRIEGSNG